MGTNTRTSQSAGEVSSELVTDGGFAEVTEANQYTSDFSVDLNGWTAGTGVIAGNIDSIDGQDNNLRYTVDGDDHNAHRFYYTKAFTVGVCYRIHLDYYIPSGQSNIDQFKIYAGATWSGLFTEIDAWTTADFYFNAIGTTILIYAYDGGSQGFKDAGADDVIYIRNARLELVTLASFTAGTGWAPQATAGALTNKAQKIAGTASDLEQNVLAIAGNTYRVVHTATRTAGSETPVVGGENGTARSSSDTFTEDIGPASTTGNLKISADATFAGTIDSFSCKQKIR